VYGSDGSHCCLDVRALVARIRRAFSLFPLVKQVPLSVRWHRSRPAPHLRPAPRDKVSIITLHAAAVTGFLKG
jgi:hypothetical protein